MSYKIQLFYLQRRRKLQHSGDQHERDGERERRGEVALARNIQVLLRHQRRVLPLRHPSLQNEMGFLDLRRFRGKLLKTKKLLSFQLIYELENLF